MAAEILLHSASAVYAKISQIKINREEVATLALRVNLLIGCLSSPEFRREASVSDNSVVSRLDDVIRRVEILVDDFAKSTGAHREFLWTGKWASRCDKINAELNTLIQMLGVQNDKNQLQYLGDIQNLMQQRRRHDDDVSEQLRLLRQAVLEVQRLRHNRLQSSLSIKQLHRTIIQEGENSRVSRKPDSEYRKGTVKSIDTEERVTGAPEAAQLQNLSPRIRSLFTKPEYKFLLLDNKLLSYKESTNPPTGAFGVIHTGVYLEQPIVIKMLLTKDPSLNAIKEILDEALILKRYSFDFFATVYGICIVEGAPAIVMKRMDTDLFRFLHDSEANQVTDSLDWKVKTSISVARAVKALNKLKILHRDLKSPNILVSGKEAEKLCLADFGMAQLRKEVASMRKSQTAGFGKYETVGSYPWMAPEIMRAGKYTEKADVYSLGVIIWEIFSKEEPWGDAISIQAIERVVLSGQNLPVNDIPQDVGLLLRQMWSIMPSRRPAAADVVTSLAAFSDKRLSIKNQKSASISPPRVEKLTIKGQKSASVPPPRRLEEPRPTKTQTFSPSDFDIPVAPSVKNPAPTPAPAPHMPFSFPAGNAEYENDNSRRYRDKAQNCVDALCESTRKMIAAVNGVLQSLWEQMTKAH